MWYDFVSQAYVATNLFVLGVAGEVSQFPMLAMVMLLVGVGVLSLTWIEVLKARNKQARWDAERAKWDAGIRIWR